MEVPTAQSTTHSAPRIAYERFLQLLKSKNSPVVPEAQAVYNRLVEEGIDPSFALAQFRVESQYGTSGYAKETGSWGNMLYDKNLTLLSGPTIKKTTSSGHTYVYATYTSYVDAVTDYARYLHWYDEQYGLDTIYEATGRWLGLSRTGDSGHIAYVTTIVNDMIAYQFPEGTFYDSGDDMIYAGAGIDRTTGRLNQKLFVARGTRLYRGTDEDMFLKTLNPATGLTGLDLFFLGPVNGSWDWGAVIVGIQAEDPKGTVVYIKKPDKTKVKTT